MNHHSRILSAIAADEWAILPEYLETIISIAERANDDPQAVAAKLGRPLRNESKVAVRGDVAIVPVTGPIFRYANLFTEISGATSVQKLALDFQAAVDSAEVESIVLDIDSPGGQVAGVSEFAEMVRASPKPVTSYISDLGASAGYWIAAAGHNVVIRDTARAGSVGVVITVRRDSEKNTIEIVSTQSPDKRLDVSSDEGIAKIQQTADKLAAIFIGAVANYRGVDTETVLSKFGRGGLLVGADAVEAGMADRLGSLESTIAGLTGVTQEAFHMTAKSETSPEITLDLIKSQYPAIADALREDGVKSIDQDALRTEGAQKERARIQSVRDQGMAGHEKLIDTLMFDGVTTGPEAAVQVLKAEKEKQSATIASIRSESPAPMLNPPAQETVTKVDPNLPFDERCKAEWESDASLRDDFNGNFDAFVAYQQANEDGRVKVLNK